MIKEIENADRLIIPGVGAFCEGIQNLKDKNLIDPIKNFSKKNKPMLGICLGMQYMMEYSEEFGKTDGLKIFEGNVKKFKNKGKYRIPHIGWNYLSTNNDKIFSNLQKNSTFYFCHSFFVDCKDDQKKLGAQSMLKVNFVL